MTQKFLLSGDGVDIEEYDKIISIFLNPARLEKLTSRCKEVIIMKESKKINNDSQPKTPLSLR